MERVYIVFTKKITNEKEDTYMRLSFKEEENGNRYILDQMSNDIKCGGELVSIDRGGTLVSIIHFPEDNKQWGYECTIEYHMQICTLI